MTKLLAISRREAAILVMLVGLMLMTFCMVQQANVIASQKTLIHQLFQDSLELNAIKMHNLPRGRVAN